jgi:hypothetical protein
MGKSRRREHSSIQHRKYISLQHMEEKYKNKQEWALEPTSLALQWWLMISSDLHGVEEPTRWMLRPQQGVETGQRSLHWRKGGRSIEAPWQSPTRGIVPFPLGRWPWKAMTSPKTSYDVTQDIL